MAGHSKWANIKHRKGRADKERAKLFVKFAREIKNAMAAGGNDPETNSSLRNVIKKAKSNNMPNDNIDRLLKGSDNDKPKEDITYEGYGPNGVAVIVECETDNRNRTASEVRAAFTKAGGNLGTTGSVSFMFETKGVIVFDATMSEDELFMLVAEAGAEDIINHGETFEVRTEQQNLMDVVAVLEENGITTFHTADVTKVATTTSAVDEDTANKINDLVEKLEDLEDVIEVHTNLE